MRSKVKGKKRDEVKEMEYVPSVTRRGKSTFMLWSISPSPPPATASPSPSKSRWSTKGSQSPTKRPQVHSPIIHTFDDDDGASGARKMKVSAISYMILNCTGNPPNSHKMTSYQTGYSTEPIICRSYSIWMPQEVQVPVQNVGSRKVIYVAKTA